jgi:hypothetical protein
MDFLYHTIPMLIHARLLIYITTREIGYTYKLDQTTVMVGAPSMLAMSTIPASMVASSSTWAPSSFSTPAVGKGTGLLSYADAGKSPTPAACCVASGTTTPVVGARLMLTVKFRQPSHEFTFGVGMTFVSYPLVLPPVV